MAVELHWRVPRIASRVNSVTTFLQCTPVLRIKKISILRILRGRISLTSITWTGAAVLVAAYLVSWRLSPLYSIPTVGGPSAPLLSYWTAWNVKHNAVTLLSDAYRKFRGTAFKMPLMDRWIVVVNGPEMVEDLRKRPDDELSFADVVQELMDIKAMAGHHADDDSHIHFIKEGLTRMVPAVFPDIIDEITLAVPAHIPAENEDWVSINVMETLPKIIARVSTRVFLGLPLCRNEDYLDLAVNFAALMGQDKTYTRMVPDIVKRLFGVCEGGTKQLLQRAVLHLRPVIANYQDQKNERGVDVQEGKPRDIIQWKVEHGEYSEESMAYSVLMLNFAAIHTSSMNLTQVLYDLATAPAEVIAELRGEIEPVVATEGWTKATMDKMWKLDSTLKESQRLNGIAMASVVRKAMKDVTLRDGTFLPRGTTVMAASQPMYQDEAKYASPAEFDPFRFARLRKQEGENMKHQFVHTSPEYVSFGHGKHACPGRFFAANELKAVLAYFLVNYDIKLAGDGSRPANIYDALSICPNPDARILFRKRQTLQSS